MKLHLSGLLSFFNGGYLPKKIPDDFKILIQSSVLQKGFYHNHSTIIKKEDKPSDFKLTVFCNQVNNACKLDKKQVDNLYKEVRNARIFSLKHSYENLSISQQSNKTMIIYAYGKSKVINMRNEQPTQLARLFMLIEEIKNPLK
jgi:CRISPR/Cas system CSM-associated protein Csm2 small subunit